MEHIKNLTVRAILAAVICVLAPIALPFGAIPLTAATFIIYTVSACMNISYSVPAVVLYVLIGCFGLPVFSGFSGGFQVISGATGGFIISYPLCAAIISLLCEKFSEKKAVYPLSMAAGTAVCYLFGTLWFSHLSSGSFSESARICVFPFILGDAVKIAAACAVCIPLRPKLRKILR